jgi:hypothetical protein
VTDTRQKVDRATERVATDYKRKIGISGEVSSVSCTHSTEQAARNPRTQKEIHREKIIFSKRIFQVVKWTDVHDLSK